MLYASDLIRWLQRKRYQYEVTFSLYMLTPTEKFIFSTFPPPRRPGQKARGLRCGFPGCFSSPTADNPPAWLCYSSPRRVFPSGRA